ncbi:MAG: hypothetical protein JXR64_01270 [Spirochaetales bacterium]|nr:hypothetical protein [Spirochaetales bacterium]
MMDLSIFKSLINNSYDTLKNLEDRKIYIVTPLFRGGLLSNQDLLEINSSYFKDDDYEILISILNSVYLNSVENPVVFDIYKGVNLYKKFSGSNEHRVKESLNLSRFTFMGTDGMRGKISTDSELDPIVSYIKDGILTPTLLELTSYGYADLLLNSGYGKIGDTLCVGNDGRDVVTNWALNNSMISGFNKAGFEVVDIGTLPTPFIPYKILHNEYLGGAALTASHNPSNQNGVKFFLKGSKILPEDLVGDYSHAAYVLHSYFNGIKEYNGFSNTFYNIESEAVTFMKNILPNNITPILNDCTIILDTANGAYHNISLKLLKEYDLDFICINSKPTGFNINKECGVAEIEGKEIYLESDYNSSLQIVKSVFDFGRKSLKTVYGIVLDGDGDRGFVLLYQRDSDRVLVLDGDKSGYLIAQYLKLENSDFKGLNFITTVESDIMTAYSAKSKLGLETPIVSVGDKWIGAYKDGEVLLGLESSGHLILPTKFVSKTGSSVELRSGNGLLTGLSTLVAIKTLKLNSFDAFEPYESGFSKTFYTYFVDKTLFFKESEVWNQDREIISKELMERGLNFCFHDKEDRNMLYASIDKENKQLGAIFCRNSGTEDKCAVYIKCDKKLENELLPIGIMLRDNHVKTMKNSNRKEYQHELKILEILLKEKEIEMDALQNLFNLKNGSSVNDSDFYSVIYGLKKEGRVLVEDALIRMEIK